MVHDFFIIHSDKHQLVNVLSQEQKGDVLDALFEYAETGVKPTLADPISQAVFISLCIEAERHWLRSDKRAEVNRENGRKGGAPKGNSNARKHDEDSELLDNSTQNNQNNPSVELLDNSTKNKNKSQSQRVDLDITSSLHSEVLSLGNDPNPNSDEDFGEEPSKPTKKVALKQSDVDFSKLADYWNEKMAGKQIPPIRQVTKKRKTAISARISEYGKEAIRKVIDKAADSKFLNGSNNRAWVADFDWVMRPNNFPKVLEGNYDNRQPSSAPAGRAERANDAAGIIAKLAAQERRRGSEVTGTCADDYEGQF